MDEFAQLLRTNKVAISIVVFKEKIVAFELVLTLSLQAHLGPLALFDAMTRYVQDEGLFPDGFLKVGLGSDFGQEFDLFTREQQSILYCLLFFAKVESWKLLI